MRATAVLLALALGACSVGGPVTDAPVPKSTTFALNARNTVDMPRYAGPTIRGAGGVELPLTVWKAESPRAVILAVHGYGDYGPSTFAAAAADWAKQGITTYAYDQRGFGRGATRGEWPGADALVADLLAVAREVRAASPCLPLIVVGHSMGGGVAAAAAGRGLDADGVVLAAPAIWGGAELNPLQRLAAWLAAAVVPDKRFTGRGVVRIQASDNVPMLRSLAADPHYLGQPSARELMGLVRVVDLASETMGGIRMPSLLLVGEKDQIVPLHSVERVYARASGRKRVIDYPDGWHLLFRDLQAARVWGDVADFALTPDLARQGAGGPACTAAAQSS